MLLKKFKIKFKKGGVTNPVMKEEIIEAVLKKG
jgi:hypothetical protein